MNHEDKDYDDILARIDDCNKISEHCLRRDVVIQAGGYRGLYPERLASLFKKVISFEADIINFEQWELKSPNIDRYNAILGKENGTAGIKRTPDHFGRTCVVKDGDIPVMTIDGLNLGELDLIYLDIEGYELNALIGGAETIKKLKPVIAVEQKKMISINGYGSNADLISFLTDHGYKRTVKYNLDVVYSPI